MKHSSIFRLVRCLALLIAIGVVASCRPSTDPAPTIVKKPEPPANVSSPRLLGLHIDGIPDANITIDSIRKTITIVLPVTITDVRPAIRYVLTPKASATPEHLDLLVTQPIALTADRAEPVAYKVVIKPGGDLRVGALPTPFVYVTGDSLPLPVQNFYDGTYSNTKLILTRKDGTEKRELPVYNYNSAAGGGDERANVFWPVISQANVAPGEYTVELTKENGRKALISQSLIVKRGPSRLLYPGGNIIRMRLTDTLSVSGVNLFANKNIDVLITDSEQRQFRVKPIRFDDNGNWVQFLAPTSLPAGYHALQLVEDGKPLSGYSRLVIINATDQPFITGLETYVFDPVSTTDLRLDRNRQYRFTFGYYCGKNMQILFKPLTAPDREVTVDPVIPGSLCQSGYGTPSFTLPNSIAPGRYRLVLRYTTYITSNRTVESEPFERVIEVR
jgi:hypothetical protein